MKAITVGIITFNGAHNINQCLKSIKIANDVPDGCKVEFLLVDDGSMTPHLESMRWVQREWQIPVIYHQENLGISKSWNDICNYGNSDYIVLLNDDILVVDNWLTCGLYFLENNDRIGTVGWDFFRIKEEDIDLILNGELIWRDKRTARLLDKQPEFFIKPALDIRSPGCSFMMSREIFNVTNGFDENYKSFYEEFQFGLELTLQGLHNITLPYPGLWHIWGHTFGHHHEKLKPSQRMLQSSMYFKEKWGGDIPEVKGRLMEGIAPTEVKWLDKQLEERSGMIGWEDQEEA